MNLIKGTWMSDMNIVTILSNEAKPSLTNNGNEDTRDRVKSVEDAT